jgi:UDPglucose 6-dehydrogenase
METVSFVGLGVVGLVTQACLASRGISTIGVDSSKNKLKKLRSGNLPFYEPKLKEVISNARPNLIFTDSIKYAMQNSDITFVTVGTPSKVDGSINLSQITDACKAIGMALRNKSSYHVVAIKSTVVPGTTDNLIKWILEKESGKNIEKDFGLIVNPELLREGSSVHDTFNPHLLVIGSMDGRAGQKIETLWLEFFNSHFPKVIRTNRVTAEIIKYANNAFLATKVSFINSIANICQRINNTDVEQVAQAIGMDPRISPLYLNAGPGYGGSCLPKDVKALLNLSHSVGYDLPLLMAVDKVNEDQSKHIVEIAEIATGGVKGKTVATLGASFKKDTDDIRESPSIKVIAQLVQREAIVRANDPMALKNLRKIFGDKITYAKNRFDCLSNADCCIILTEWDEYRSMKADDFVRYMKKPCIVDARRIFDPQDFGHPINYFAIGLNIGYEKAFSYTKVMGTNSEMSLDEVNLDRINLGLSLNAIRERGVLVADNERYTIHDLEVNELTVSLTELKKEQETRGHSHVDCSEIYFFREGRGKMQVGVQMHYVTQGTVIIVSRGEFHKVINLGTEKLIFVAVFEGKRSSKKYNFKNDYNISTAGSLYA